MKPETVLRIARPTDRLESLERFYTEALGLSRLDSFEDHEGFDGIMLGLPGASWHLELTRRRGHAAGRAPSKEHLLVVYLPDDTGWERAVARMKAAGYEPVPSLNPYWDRAGLTFEDPDGYRVVLQHDSWNPHADQNPRDIR